MTKEIMQRILTYADTKIVVGICSALACSCGIITLCRREYERGLWLIIISILIFFISYLMQIVYKLSEDITRTRNQLTYIQEERDNFIRQLASLRETPVTTFYRTEFDLPSEGVENAYYVVTNPGRVLQWNTARRTFVSAPPIDTYHILHDMANDNWLNSQDELVNIKAIIEKPKPIRKRPNIFKELLSRRKE